MRAFAAAALLLASLQAFATAAPSSLSGRVTTGGAAAAGVTVTATSPALQGQRTTVTTANGRYWLTALPPGEYDVTFSRAGMQTLIKRAVVQVGRVARVDAALEPSEDEESVTSTAIVIGVADTTAITSHFDDRTLDRLPIAREAVSAAFLSTAGFSLVLQDDAFTYPADVDNQEALEQLTVLRGALPAEYDFAPPLIHARTRSGGEDFHVSLRDTLTSDAWSADLPIAAEEGVQQLIEAGAGGRLMPERLWFFAAAMYGSELYAGDRRGFLGKLTAQPAAEHHLTALYDHTVIDPQFELQTQLATVHYTGTVGPRWTNDAVLSRAAFDQTDAPTDIGIPTFERDTLFAKSTYVLGTRFGDHILTGGAQQTDDVFHQGTAFFAGDRWIWDRMIVNLGVRHENDRFLPRAAASFDLRGDGRHAIQATFSDYQFGVTPGRELTVGYATALGNGGSARIDGIRRDFGPVAVRNVQFELRYSLFDRLQVAANYVWRDNEDIPSIGPNSVANAWLTVALPLGTHELAITALERFQSAIEPFADTAFVTDFALRYALPIRSLGLTLAVDVTNVFDQHEHVIAPGRSARGWVRLRL